MTQKSLKQPVIRENMTKQCELRGKISKFEVQEGRSESLLLLETPVARYFRYFELKMWPITGGMTVETKLERVEKATAGVSRGGDASE